MNLCQTAAKKLKFTGNLDDQDDKYTHNIARPLTLSDSATCITFTTYK